MNEMYNYVIGFLFSEDRKNILLIEKQKPLWQKGLWNAIGGKIKKTDNNIAFAMSREFYEETTIQNIKWKNFCNLYGDNWNLNCFVSFNNKIYSYQHVEEEKPMIFPLSNIPPKRISNLDWLITLALDNNINIPLKIQDLN